MRCAVSLALCLCLLGAAGCGSSNEEKTPVACLAGPATFVRAVDGDGRLAGNVAISSCLTENQGAGDLAQVGGSLVTAATRLNAEARRRPLSGAPAHLGFLVGAVARGASDTGGIHAVLLQRVTAAATYRPGGRAALPQIKALYARGYAEGRAHG
jgi:hypothetical protein